MVLVVPTDRWLNQTIRIPWVGRISRNGRDQVDVSPVAARYLVENCFAQLVEGESLPEPQEIELEIDLTLDSEGQPMAKASQHGVDPTELESNRETTPDPSDGNALQSPDTSLESNRETTPDPSDDNAPQSSDTLEPEAPDSETSGVLEEQTNSENTSSDQGVTEDSSATLEEWQTLALEFLNSSSTDTIAEAIDGVGPKTAESLVVEKPLDWQAVERILTKAQISALHKWTVQ